MNRVVLVSIASATLFAHASPTVSSRSSAQEPHEDSGANSAKLVAALSRSKCSLQEGIHLAMTKSPEAAISAKFEFDDKGALSLSVYTAEKGLGVGAEHNVLKELSGSPEAAPWKPEVEVFKDVPHVARASEQLTLMSMTLFTLAEITKKAEKDGGGTVFSVAPLLEDRKPRFLVLVAARGQVSTLRYNLISGERVTFEK